jgi:hypothetical protein
VELSKGCPIFKWHGAEKVRRSNDRNAVMARSNLQYEVTSATSRKRKADLIKPKRLPRKVDQILNALLARFGFAFRQEARVLTTRKTMDQWLQDAPALTYVKDVSIWLIVNKWGEPISWTDDPAEVAWFSLTRAISQSQGPPKRPRDRKAKALDLL